MALMQYGSVQRVTSYHDGRITKDIKRHTESTDVKTIEGAHQLLDEMMAKGLVDPAINIETHTSTGKIKRVVKSWTDPSSKVF